MSSNDPSTLANAIKRGRKTSFFVAIGLIVTASPGVPTFAQDSSVGAIEEILVTARKREESVQDVPGVVTVLSGEALRANGTTDAKALAQNTPGVIYSETFTGASAPRITIRGVGDDDFNPNGSASAAIHVNGVYQGTNGLLNSQYFDIDRAEVLKGPQGTLYGRNATAGAVNFVTRRPSDELGGYIDLEVGDFGARRVEGAVDLPASDAVRFRVAALVDQSDGYFTHQGTGPATGFTYAPGTVTPQEEVPSQGDWGGADRFSGRVTAEFDLSDSTLLTAVVTAGTDDSELPIPDVTTQIFADYTNGQAFFLDFNDPSLAGYGPALDSDPFTVFANALPVMDSEQFGANLQLEHDFVNDLTGTVIAAYESLDRDYSTSDNLPFSVADYLFANEYSQLTLEARLAGSSSDSVGWIVGLFALDDEVDFSTNLLFLNSGLWQTNTQTDYVQERSSFGVFGTLDWAVSDTFTLETGVRFSSDEVTFDGLTQNLDPFGVFGTPPTFFPPGSVFIGNPIDPVNPLLFSENFDDDEFTWKVSAIFQPSDRLSVYGTVSTGYKAGGFDGSTILTPQEALPIESETAIAYEGGVKFVSSAGTATAEANVFYYDFSDYQSTALLNVAGAVTNVRANVADATIQGAEFLASFTPTESFLFSAGVAVLDTEIEEFFGTSPDIQGNELPFAPELSWNAKAVYTADVSDRLSIQAQVDASHTGEHFQTINNNDEVSDYTVTNARLGFQFETWEIAIYARNLFDEDYDVGFFPSTGLTPDTFFKGAPRTYGVNLTANF